MAKGLFDKLADKLSGSDFLGWYGETLTKQELWFVKLFGRKGKTLGNIYVPKDDGGTTEIDVVYITQKGIFVIESKNYSGWIFGDENDSQWTAMLANKQKNRFYNPIKQNRTHIKWLGKLVGDEVPLFSIIVFSERCELKKVSIYSSDVRVIKRDYLYGTIRSIWNETPDKLDEARVSEIYTELKKLSKADQSVKEAHVNAIKEKYQKSEPLNEAVTESAEERVDEICTDEECPAVESSDESVAEIKSESDNNDSIAQTEDIETEAQISAPAEPVKKTDAEIEKEYRDLFKAVVAESGMLCPKCGGQLVLRTARRGARAGNQFYGCSNYPNCRFIRNTSE